MNHSTIAAFFTSFAVCYTLLTASPLHGLDNVGVSVLPDLPQILVLHLKNKKSLRVEGNCEIPDGAVGESDWRGLARQNGIGVQVLSVHFGTCRVIFARIVHGGGEAYGLIGDVGLPMGESPMVFYSRFGADLLTQINNLVTLIGQNALPTSIELASIAPLSSK